MGQADLEQAALKFAREHQSQITRLIRTMSAEFNLDKHTSQLDQLIAGEYVTRASGPTNCATKSWSIISAFRSGCIWALLISNWRDLAEFDEIKVDRISPEDVRACRSGATETLRGNRLAHLGHSSVDLNRENDYLWGRMHGADRLIDIVCDAAGVRFIRH